MFSGWAGLSELVDAFCHPCREVATTTWRSLSPSRAGKYGPKYKAKVLMWLDVVVL